MTRVIWILLISFERLTLITTKADKCFGHSEIVDYADDIISEVAVTLDWHDVIIIHDGSQNTLLTKVTENLDSRMTTYSLYDLTIAIEASNRITLPEEPKHGVCVILLCNDNAISYIMNPKNNTDNLVNDKANLELMWFVVSLTSEYDIPDVLYKSNIDNVLLMKPYHTDCLESKPGGMHFKLLTLMWRTGRRRELETRAIYTYNGQNITTGSLYPNLQYGLNAKTLFVASLPSVPLCSLDNSTGSMEMGGLYGEILHDLARHFNFTYRIILPPDGEWGRLFDNGSWTGLIRMLRNKEVDMVMAPLAISYQRSRAIEFGTPADYDHSTFFMRTPQPDVSKWTLIMEPFHWSVFIIIVCILIVSSACLMMVEKLSSTLRNKRNVASGSFGDCFWYLFGAMLIQGGVYSPRSHAGAILISTFWLYSIIIMVIYAGSLMAQLTVSKRVLTIDSIEKLTKQTTHKVGTLGGSYYPSMLKNSALPLYNELYRKIEKYSETDPDVLSKDVNVHHNKVKSEDYIFIFDMTYIKTMTAGNCSLHLSTSKFETVQEAPGLPKGSPYRKMFSERILSYHENGLIPLWRQKYIPTRECPNVKGKKNFQSKPLDISDLLSAFLCLGGGVTIALINIIIENIYSRNKNKKS